MVFAFITGIDKAILALGVQLHQHAQCGPLGATQGRKLPVLVSGQGEESITPIHEVTAQQWVRVHNWRQSVDNRPSMQVNYKEDL